VFDLSHAITDGMQTYPGDPDVTCSAATTFETDGYRVTELGCGSHTGTHVDAPSHTEADGASLDAFDLDRFVLRTVRVDCQDLGARDAIPPERVPERDTPADDETSREIECIVFHTGWDEHWGTETYLDHPYLAPETAQLCAERGFAVGIDALNPDPTPTASHGEHSDDEPSGVPAHHALLGNDCLIFENLTALETVPEVFELRAYPLPLGADGAPVRAVGVPLSGL
jgi:kynurenine formamidase